MGFYDNLPGYENPIGKDAPSWGGDYDWKGAGGNIDWEKPSFDVASKKTDWGEAFKGLFDKTRDTDKWQSYASSQKPIMGEGSKPYAGQVLENLGVVYPQQHAPVFVPGVEGKKGFGGTIGSIVGGIGGALIGGPAGFGIGSQLGGGVGSMF